MRESMARLTPQFSANRTVCEYTEQHYLPAAASHLSRMAKRGAGGGKIADWRRSLEQNWGTVRFGEVRVETRAGQHRFEVEVYFNDLDPKAVRVELCADCVTGGNPVREEMKCIRQMPRSPGARIYSAAVSANRPSSDFTARLIPHRDGVAVPLEAAHILWQH